MPICPVCTLAAGVEAAVRTELAAMPEVLVAAPALAASALKLGERLDGKLLDLAPAPLHAELRNTLKELRAYANPKTGEVSVSDEIAARRDARRASAANS